VSNDFPNTPAEGGQLDGFSQHPDTETLSASLDGRLAAWERETVAMHVASCSDCRRELTELRATVLLLNDLPRYEPRRSFQVSPRQLRPAPGESWAWFTRLLPALPALRTATVAVAILLMVVSAGDVLVHRNGDESSDTTAPPGEVLNALGTETVQPASNQQADEPMMAEQDAPSTTSGSGAAAAGVQPDLDQAADQQEGGQQAPMAAAPASDNAVATVPASVERIEETRQQTEIPEATGQSGSSASSARNTGPPRTVAATPRQRPSTWRLTEVGLGLILLWLIVTVAGLQRLRRRT